MNKIKIIDKEYLLVEPEKRATAMKYKVRLVASQDNYVKVPKDSIFHVKLNMTEFSRKTNSPRICALSIKPANDTENAQI